MAKREAISQKLRFKILERDNFTCQYCGRKPPEVTLEPDHIISVDSGGSNEEFNLITSCRGCNNGKREKSNSAVAKVIATRYIKNKISDIFTNQIFTEHDKIGIRHDCIAALDFYTGNLKTREDAKDREIIKLKKELESQRVLLSGTASVETSEAITKAEVIEGKLSITLKDGSVIKADNIQVAFATLAKMKIDTTAAFRKAKEEFYAISGMSPMQLKKTRDINIKIEEKKEKLKRLGGAIKLIELMQQEERQCASELKSIESEESNEKIQ